MKLCGKKKSENKEVYRKGKRYIRNGPIEHIINKQVESVPNATNLCMRCKSLSVYLSINIYMCVCVCVCVCVILTCVYVYVE